MPQETPKNDGWRTGPARLIGAESSGEAIEKPAKVERIAAMARQVLEEARRASLDEAARRRLETIYEMSVRELAAGELSADLTTELRRQSITFRDGTPSAAQARLAQAQLVGWLDGLADGMQAAMLSCVEGGTGHPHHQEGQRHNQSFLALRRSGVRA
jgi:Protein of unknown function (DUF2587)